MSSSVRGIRAIQFSSLAPKSGSTTLSLATARWLHEQGVHVAPLHFGDPGLWRPVACPSAGMVSWPAALLAEACGLPPEPLFEAGESAFEPLARRFDALVVDRGANSEVTESTLVTRSGRLRFALFGQSISLKETQPLPALEPEPADLLALPDWQPGAGPRFGVISLPHIDRFADWTSLRGADWLTTPGIGQYGFVFVPMTSDRGFDRTWMDEQGLTPWLRQQAASGARVVSVGWSLDFARRVEPEIIQDDCAFSRLTGVRWPRRLPSDRDWEALTAWIERGVGRQLMLRLLP